MYDLKYTPPYSSTQTPRLSNGKTLFVRPLVYIRIFAATLVKYRRPFNVQLRFSNSFKFYLGGVTRSEVIASESTRWTIIANIKIVQNRLLAALELTGVALSAITCASGARRDAIKPQKMVHLFLFTDQAHFLYLSFFVSPFFSSFLHNF